LHIPTTPTQPPATPQPARAEQTPQFKLKEALLKRIDKLAKQKAAGLAVDFKEFMGSLVKRSGGKRHELTIDQLKEQLRYLEQIRINE
jgi:hypothetical protein